MSYTQLTNEGHVVIPDNLLHKFNFGPGTKMVIVETEAGLTLKLVSKDFIASLRGKYRDLMPDRDEYFNWKKEERELEEAKMRRIFGE